MGTLGSYTSTMAPDGGFGFGGTSFGADVSVAVWGADTSRKKPSSPATSPSVNPIVATPPPLQPVRTAGGSLSFSEAGYGNAIPLVFGADKVTGNVIWASPIQTNQVAVDGEYIQFQSVDFALALCEGPIEGVLRIWLGDRLIYDNTMPVSGNTPQTGANGVINTRTLDITDPGSPLSILPVGEKNTSFTVFSGSETQVPYGPMADDEGIENTPAYRGISYILFENFITSGTNTPSIIVEVAANTTGFFPRLDNTPQGSDLTTATNDGLLVAPAWNQIYYVGEGAGSGDTGLIAVNYASLEEEANFEVENTYFGGGNINWAKSIVTSLGNIVGISGGSGNSGIMRSINPLAGVGIASLGPNSAGTGGEFYINELGFPALITDMCTVAGFDEFGNYVDFVFATGNWQKDIGMIKVGDFGSMLMSSFETNIFPKDNQKIEVLKVSSYRHGLDPTWPNGDSTYGNYIFYMSVDDTEDDQIDVGYIKLSSADPDDVGAIPIEYQFVGVPTGAIDVDLLGGKGVDHEPLDIVPITGTGLLLLFIKTTPSALPDWIVKYNPYTNTIIWKAGVDLGTAGSFTYQSRADLDGADQYCFVDANSAVIGVNLTTGAVRTVVDDIVADQSLPARVGGGGQQFYDGVENSIVYFSSGQINKVFLERTAVGLTSVPVIITKLFGRIGITEADIGYKQINALNLRGYTITDITTIKEVINSLRQVYTFEVVESNGRLSYVSRGGTAITTIENKWLRDVNGVGGYLPFEHGIDIAELRKLDITYRDIDREYMENVQNIYYPSVENNEFDQDSGIDVSVPVVLNADEARYLADKLLYSKRVNEVKLRAVLPFRFSYLDPGDIVNVEVDDAGTDVVQCRITRQTLTRDMQVEVELVEEDVDIYNEDPGFGGVIGRFFRIAFPELDPLYRIYVLGIDYRVFPNGTMDNGWAYSPRHYFCILDLLRSSSDVSTDVSLRSDITAYKNWQSAINYYYNPPPGTTGGSIREPTWLTPRKVPSWGFLTDIPGYASSPFTVFENNTMTVRIMHERTGWEFTSYSNFGVHEWYTEFDYATRNTDALSLLGPLISTFNGENTLVGNTLLVGNEKIRFRQVTDNGDGTYTFTGLMRAVDGTDWDVDNRSPGEIVVLLRRLDGTFDDEAIQEKLIGMRYAASADDTSAVYQRRMTGTSGWTNTKAGFDFTAYRLVSNNPRQTNPVYLWAPWTLMAPNPHVDAVYDGSGNVDISWTPRGFQRISSNFVDQYIAAGGTSAISEVYTGAVDEWVDDGDHDDVYRLGGLTNAQYKIVLSTAPITGFGTVTSATGFLRTITTSAGAETYEYTTAMQTEDSFDSSTDVLYIYVWPINPATEETLIAPRAKILRNL